ncbi:MAG TPA: hypothetical protein VJZ00_17800, partial [Thermoanaerobaculia bacterium]|nr:hypothetical protein [Thermoanaerobaculia bacterium]
MNAERRADAIAIAVLALLPLLLFSDLLLGIHALYTRDLPFYYYPAKKVLRDVALSGHFPYWNPFFSAGQPLAANPEHEVFYPLTWLILLPNFDFAFHLLIVLHVSIAMITMYALLRSMSMRRAAAFLGALSFGLGGAVLSTLDLLPVLFSLAWLPLTCLFTRRFLLHRASRDFALAAFFLGLQLVIGEPATALQTGILLGAYALWKQRARGVGAIALLSGASLLIAAVQVLPAADHVADSVRSRGLDYDLVSYWSTPPARVAELVYPSIFGDPRLDQTYQYRGARFYDVEQRPYLLSIYCGLLVAVLMLAGLIARVRGAALFGAIAIASALLAFGRHTPLLRLLYESGLASWLRYPEKFVLMGLFAAIVFAARVFDGLLDGDARVRRAALGITGIVTLAAFAVPDMPIARGAVLLLLL